MRPLKAKYKECYGIAREELRKVGYVGNNGKYCPLLVLPRGIRRQDENGEFYTVPHDEPKIPYMLGFLIKLFEARSENTWNWRTVADNNSRNDPAFAAIKVLCNRSRFF